MLLGLFGRVGSSSVLDLLVFVVDLYRLEFLEKANLSLM